MSQRLRYRDRDEVLQVRAGDSWNWQCGWAVGLLLPAMWHHSTAYEEDTGGARRKMKRMGIGQLKKEITAKKIIAWGPMEIMADGEVAGVLLPPKHEGTLAVRETEAKRTGKQEGTQAKVLAFGKEKQAAGKMRQGG